MKIRVLFFALLWCCVPAFAFAHPGHGHTDPGSWRHYLEPVHVATLVSALSLVVSVVVYRRRLRASSVAG